MTELLCIFRYCIFGYHCRRRMRGSLLGRVSFFLDRVKGFLELSFISAMREIFVIRVSIYSCMFPNKHGLKFSACSVYVFFASVVYALLIPKSCIFTNLPNLPHFRSDGISWPQWTPFRIRQSRLRNSRSIAIEIAWCDACIPQSRRKSSFAEPTQSRSLPNALYGHASEKRTFLETRTV